jgi:endoglucanase
LTDEWFWAAAEMHLLKGMNDMGAPGYRQKLAAAYQAPLTPKWDRVNTLGMISLLTSEQRAKFPEYERDFLAHVDWLLESEARSPYQVSLDRFAWGSNSDVANDGMLKLVAWRLSGDPVYLASAQNDMDYILGRNATGFSFVTGFGDKTPKHPHNRIMGADGIDQPIPGFISGGPNVNVLTDCEAEGVVRSEFPAASFTDSQCSYSTNETAINWNAPLVFLTSGLEHHLARTAPSARAANSEAPLVEGPAHVQVVKGARRGAAVFVWLLGISGPRRASRSRS